MTQTDGYAVTPIPSRWWCRKLPKLIINSTNCLFTWQILIEIITGAIYVNNRTKGCSARWFNGCLITPIRLDDKHIEKVIVLCCCIAKYRRKFTNERKYTIRVWKILSSIHCLWTLIERRNLGKWQERNLHSVFL